MNPLSNAVVDIVEWIKSDYRTWPLRFILELVGWGLSITCSVAMALTVPNPPFLILYPLFIIQCAIFGWAARTRGSSGMVANYLLLVSIDTIALIRLISN